jgi:protein-L-isoaspartate(D-aspartate) O-methyltransferase
MSYDEDKKEDMAEDRKRLVDSLVERGYVESDAVEKAMRSVPREHFVPDNFRGRAYEDSPLSIGEGQTISAPHMVAMITERLNLSEGNKVLEIGTGRGYHAAVVAEIVGAENVYTVERHQKLAQEARENLPDEVTVVTGDGSKGLPAHAPYDKIYLTCAAPEVPEFLNEQLREGGRAVLPVQKGGVQHLTRVDKSGGKLEVEEGEPVRFVRLVGDEGF